jgi:hypothetical protein
MQVWTWLFFLSFVSHPLEDPFIEGIRESEQRVTLQKDEDLSQKNRPFKKKLTRLGLDVLFIGGVTTGVVFARENIQEAIRESGAFENVIDNFRNPVLRIKKGTRLDDDPFLINYVAHPLAYAGMGLYLKERGYRDWTALLFTQIHNIAWEFAIEGSAFPPSGKDLVTDYSASIAGIFVLDRVSRYGEKKLSTENRRFYHYLFYYLNPFNVLDDKLLKKPATQVSRIPKWIKPGIFLTPEWLVLPHEHN